MANEPDIVQEADQDDDLPAAIRIQRAWLKGKPAPAPVPPDAEGSTPVSPEEQPTRPPRRREAPDSFRITIDGEAFNLSLMCQYQIAPMIGQSGHMLVLMTKGDSLVRFIPKYGKEFTITLPGHVADPVRTLRVRAAAAVELEAFMIMFEILEPPRMGDQKSSHRDG